MSKVFDIINGWANYLTKDKKALELAKTRLAHCVECTDDNGHPNLIDGWYLDDELEDAKGKKCKVCTCPASTITRSKDYKCPLGKW